MNGVTEVRITRRPRKRGVKAGEDWFVTEGIAEGVAEGLVVVEEDLITEEGAAMAGEEVPSLLPNMRC